MKAPIRLTIGEAQKLIAHEHPTILDARDAHSYKAGHISGAMLLHDDLIAALVKRREIEQALLIYCFRGQLSMAKGRLFAAAGFQRVYSLAGGFVAWQRAA